MLSISLLAIAPERIGHRTWNKHYTLYIEEGDGAEQLVRQLADSGKFQGVVSRYTTEISFNTFAGFSSIPVNRIPSRLDSLDPRFDPYMRRIPMLFSVESDGLWEVVYLRTDTNVVSTYLYLRRVYRQSALRWRLIDFDPLGTTIRVLIWVVYLIVVARLSSNAPVRLAVLLASLPWLVLVALADFSALLAFFLLVPAWLHLFELLREHWYDRSLFGRPESVLLVSRPIVALAVAVGLGILVRVPKPIGGLLLSMAGTVPAAALLYCLINIQDSSRAHQPFRAQPILKRFRMRRTSIFPAISPYVLLALIVLCSYPLLRLAASLSGPSVEAIRMQPIGDKRASLSWSSLTALDKYTNPDGIPNLADYLAHRAYQESLIFGRPYEFPTMGERILVSEYRIDEGNGRVHKTFRVVKQFKESWLYETVKASLPGSEARLLVDQGFAGTVEMTAAADPAVRYGISGMAILLFLFQFLVPRHFNLTASVLYATKNLTLRRH